jgi:hypothetical protein
MQAILTPDFVVALIGAWCLAATVATALAIRAIRA